MKRKTLHTWLSCVALLLACLMVLTVLAGCKNPSENPTGTGTGNGTSTEAPATTTGKSDKTEGPEFPEACDNHKGNFICENCGKRMTPNGFFTTMKATEADEAINVLVDNLSVTAKGDLIKIEKAELTLKLVNNVPVVTGYAKGTVTEKGETEATPFEGTLILKDGKISVAATATPYGETENAEAYATLEGVLGELPDNIRTVIGEILPKLPAFINGQLIPALKAIVEAHPELEDICARIADLFLTVTKTDNGYTVALSFDRLLALNEKFKTVKIGEFYDSILGEGAFAKLKTYANDIFGKTVSDVLGELKNEGIDVVALMKMVNSLLPVDESGKTVMSQVLEQMENEKFLATTIGQLFVETDQALTAEQIKALQEKFASVLNTVEAMTVWEGIEDLMSKGDENRPIEPQPDDASGYAAPETDGGAAAPSMADMVKSVLEMYKDQIKISYTTDAYGKVLSTNIELALEVKDESGDGTAVKFAISGKIQLVNKYTSEIDYSKTEEKVKADLDSLNAKMEQIANLIKADLEERKTGAVVTFNKTTGILNAKYTDESSYTSIIHEDDGSTKNTRIIEKNQVELEINLKSVLTMSISDDCKNLRAIYVYYAMTAKNDLKITATWANVENSPLTNTELEKYYDQIVKERTVVDDNGYSISMLLDITTGDYSANDHSTHDYDYEHPVKTGEPDADGWYRVYYKCKKCGKINWQSHKDN